MFYAKNCLLFKLNPLTIFGFSPYANTKLLDWQHYNVTNALVDGVCMGLGLGTTVVLGVIEILATNSLQLSYP